MRRRSVQDVLFFVWGFRERRSAGRSMDGMQEILFLAATIFKVLGIQLEGVHSQERSSPCIPMDVAQTLW